ncbi:MAG: copper amine oxidase N-terminal domain-containing protein [Nitrososphaeria archaeon]
MNNGNTLFNFKQFFKQYCVILSVTLFFILATGLFNAQATDPIGSTKESAILVSGKYIYDYTATTLRPGKNWFKYELPVAGKLTISKTADELNEKVNFYFELYMGDDSQPFITKTDAHLLYYEDSFSLTLSIDKVYEPIYIAITVSPQDTNRKLFGINFKYTIPTMKMIVGNPVALIEDREYSMDVAPIIIFNRTMVPVRFVSEAFGLKVEWANKERKVVISGINLEIVMFIENRNIKITNKNGTKYIASDVPPKIINDRTFLPLRTVSEILGANVNWNEKNKQVTIDFSRH